MHLGKLGEFCKQGLGQEFLSLSLSLSLLVLASPAFGLTISAGSTQTLNGSNETIDNHGTLNASGVFTQAVTTHSGSTININNDTFFQHSGTFTNATGANFNASGSTVSATTFWGSAINNGNMSITGTSIMSMKKFTNNGNIILRAGVLNDDSGTSDTHLGSISVSNIDNDTYIFENTGLITVDASGLNLNKPYLVFYIYSSSGAQIAGTEIAEGIEESTDGTTGVKIINAPGAYLYEIDVASVYLTLTSIDNAASNANQQAIYNALEQAIKNTGANMSANAVRQAVKDTDKILKESANSPRALMNAFKQDATATALQAGYTSFLTATSAAIMSDASSVSEIESASRMQAYATPFGGGFSGNDTSGYLVGVALGFTYFADDYIAQGNFAYAHGANTQDLATQSNELSGNLVQLGGFGRYFWKKAEFDANVNFVLGMFELDNAWQDAATLNSSASFNDYELNFGAVGGWRFDELGESEVARAFSVKPFAGLQFYYDKQGEYSLDGLGLDVEALSDFRADILAGVEGRYLFKNGNFAYVKLAYEQKLFNTQKDFSVRLNGTSGVSTLGFDNESYDGFFTANLGGRVWSNESWRFDLEGVFKHYDDGLNYFGANLKARYAF